MRKTLIALFAGILMLYAPFACSANSATEQTALPMHVCGHGPVRPVTIVIDTTGSDLTVYTPASGYMACLVGSVHSEADAATVIVKSGSTTIEPSLQLGANQGTFTRIGTPILCSAPGDALKIQSGTAIAGLLWHIVEAKEMNCK